jgi:hypothetical protein
MRKREKRQALKVVFTIIIVLAILTVASLFYTPAVDAATWITNTHEFFEGLAGDIGDNVNLFAFLAAVVAGGYYFFVYRPKVR